MKIFFLLTVILFLSHGCGKKADPEYQGKINQNNLNI
jgi:hypothetical protein|tara:strand:+ start:565 stop:675 length:111 start_codon:yes stop_codon:yes gene_type:complete